MLGVPVLCNFFIWEGLELTHGSTTVLTLALGKQNPFIEERTSGRAETVSIG